MGVCPNDVGGVLDIACSALDGSVHVMRTRACVRLVRSRSDKTPPSEDGDIYVECSRWPAAAAALRAVAVIAAGLQDEASRRSGVSQAPLSVLAGDAAGFAHCLSASTTDTALRSAIARAALAEIVQEHSCLRYVQEWDNCCCRGAVGSAIALYLSYPEPKLRTRRFPVPTDGRSIRKDRLAMSTDEAEWRFDVVNVACSARTTLNLVTPTMPTAGTPYADPAATQLVNQCYQTTDARCLAHPLGCLGDRGEPFSPLFKGIARAGDAEAFAIHSSARYSRVISSLNSAALFALASGRSMRGRAGNFG
jgi:hypothetical protein